MDRKRWRCPAPEGNRTHNLKSFALPLCNNCCSTMLANKCIETSTDSDASQRHTSHVTVIAWSVTPLTIFSHFLILRCLEKVSEKLIRSWPRASPTGVHWSNTRIVLLKRLNRLQPELLGLVKFSYVCLPKFYKILICGKFPTHNKSQFGAFLNVNPVTYIAK